MTEFVADPPDDEPERTGVRALPPVKLDVAGITYSFHCPKLAVWAEMAVPALKQSAAGQATAYTGSILLFLHACLTPADSDALQARKYDDRDPLDLPDLVRAFIRLVGEWREDVSRISEEAGLRLDLGKPAPPAKRAPAGAKRRR